MKTHAAIRLAVHLVALAVWLPAMANPDDAPGREYLVKPADLPPPFATPSASNSADQVRRKPGQRPVAVSGYDVAIFAQGLNNPRWMTVAPNGDVFLAQPAIDEVTLLVDANGDGRADDSVPFVTRMDTPHGLALHGGYLYIADLRGISRVLYLAGQRRATSAPEPVTPPGAFGGSGGHWTRNIAFSADGRHVFAAIGSASNIGEEPSPRATVTRFNADGTNGGTYASGLRNPVGIAVHPETGELYVVVNERDGLGDGLVPDYLTRVREGEFFGWPYAYIGGNPQPRFAERRPDLVARSIVPDVLFESHSAPLGLVFANSEQFPPDWRDDAFVALHGSWNAAQPTGYKVVRVPFENGRPVGGYVNFVTGFRIGTETGWGGTATAQVFGRPAGLALWRDGSLLIADDGGDVIWRVYRKAPN
jgi:glucose/arabinose dehydrogenase